MCLAQGPQGSDALRLKPAALQSRVKHSTTEPFRSQQMSYFQIIRQYEQTFDLFS